MMGAEGGLKKCLKVLRQKDKKMTDKAVHRAAMCKGTRHMVFWTKVLVLRVLYSNKISEQWIDP